MLPIYHRTGLPAGSEVKMLKIRHRIARLINLVDKITLIYHRTGLPVRSVV